jgi:sporulation protein YlmC with PRC-barrel domain
MKKTLFITTLATAFIGTVAAPLAAQAQVAGGTTTVGATVVASTQLALGWSVKKTLMGKTVYNEAGAKVGKVEDLIVSPEKAVSYVIVGAGGFVGIGRHDVAVPVTQIQATGGKLVMAGATKESIKAMARFDYTDDHADRNAFIAQADRDIIKGKADIATLQKKADAAATETKAALNVQVAAVQADLKAAEVKLSDMKSAAASRWKEFEAGVSDANARLRKSLDKALA